MKAWVFGEEPSGGGMSGAPSQQIAGAGSPGLPMLPEQPDCGAPCALCESLAHLLAQAREEIVPSLIAVCREYRSKLDKLDQDNAALRGLVETLREYAQSLAYEWAWKRDSSLANDREMQALDAAIDAARAAPAKEDKP